ncbi:MAG: DUF2326 domain-containing protein [Spirochaetia bacterium]|jgi:uncharacterized protein YydD (DUF2326 family)|nr:DUF2326 domain-containing protein [Spirochaetia bacterium]
MFIKSLEIYTGNQIIRSIRFHAGLNLIIDTTSAIETKKTGNNVGKTTVIELVDFCFGAKPGILYKDKENEKDEYELVKNFLIAHDIHIKATFADNLHAENAQTVTIERNFLNRPAAIRKINGKQISLKDFDTTLIHCFYPDLQNKKPTFRQLVSHNLRYREENLEKTIKTLDKYTTLEEYETLYVYLLGCPFQGSEQKQNLIEKLKEDLNYLNRLTKTKSKAAYKIGLTLITQDIDKLNKRKESLDIDAKFKNHVMQLDNIKYAINKTSSIQSRLKMRKQLIEEAVAELSKQISNINLKQLKDLYTEASNNVAGIQKTFDDLVEYHNKMIQQKVKYISSDLSDIIKQIESNDEKLNVLLIQEKELSITIKKHETFDTLEQIIEELNENYRIKGEYEGILDQIETTEKSIANEKGQLQKINDPLFSQDFDTRLQKKIDTFNTFFSTISKTLYGELYYLTKEIVTDKKTGKLYEFKSFNANMSSGKKQGEILCFDLAYILFARKEHIPCMEFLMNDKKELLHNNQLQKVADFVMENNIQLILPMLRDKVPEGLLRPDTVVLELSQDSKLFRIEETEHKQATGRI